MANLADSFNRLGEATRELEKILSWNQKKAIEDAKIRIRSNGGEVREKAKVIFIPPRPGLKVWSAIDCLVHYNKYVAIRKP